MMSVDGTKKKRVCDEVTALPLLSLTLVVSLYSLDYPLTTLSRLSEFVCGHFRVLLYIVHSKYIVHLYLLYFL